MKMKKIGNWLMNYLLCTNDPEINKVLTNTTMNISMNLEILTLIFDMLVKISTVYSP